MTSNKLWRCEECGHEAMRSDLLEAVNPFLPDDHVLGCPKCKACNPVWIEVCDEPGCKAQATCGTPSKDGYRRTCYKHAPSLYEFPK